MKGIIINQDADCQFSRIGREGGCTIEQLENFPKQFAGTQVTDYVMCLCNITASFPSKTWTSVIDKYHQTVENGQAVDYTDANITKGAHHIFEVLGVDHIAIYIKGFREAGINPWISFRMNDIHDHHHETSMLLSDFYHEHPELRRVKFHPEFRQTNADNAYNYAEPLVREHYKALIDEALDRYDPYGIELDFQREIELFAIGDEYIGVEIMNGFIHEIDGIVHKYEAKYGHEIKISVRVAPDIQTNLDFGLNVMQWVQEGIIDLVIPTGRFESHDTDMPIKLWKTLLAPYNVELAPCIEQIIRPYPTHEPLGRNIETIAACAANMYTQGADKIAFYNFFFHPAMTFERTIDLDPGLPIGSPRGYYTVINTVGSPETVQKINRRHVTRIRTDFRSGSEAAARISSRSPAHATRRLSLRWEMFREGRE